VADPFPTQPFYIQWKYGLSDYVIGSGGWDNDRKVLRLKVHHRTGDPDQLWTATPDPRGGMVLSNLGDLSDVFQSAGPLVLTVIDVDMSGPWFGLCIQEFNPAEPLQLFSQIDAVPDPWIRICPATLAFKHVCVLDNDPNKDVVGWTNVIGEGGDEALWNLIPETGTLAFKSIDYDLKQATSNLGVAPRYFEDDTIENTTDTPLTGSKQFSWQTSKSRTLTNSYSQTSASTFTQTFGIKGGIKDVVEVSESSTFSTSQSDTEAQTDGTTTTETHTEVTTINWNVPAHKTYQYAVKESAGKVSVPYTATATFKSSVAGIHPRDITIQGIFEGVNVVRTEIEVRNITDSDSVVVETKPAAHHRLPGKKTAPAV
jgi:hypothetical protein